jgi:hypothetical protein
VLKRAADEREEQAATVLADRDKLLTAAAASRDSADATLIAPQLVAAAAQLAPSVSDRRREAMAMQIRVNSGLSPDPDGTAPSTATQAKLVLRQPGGYVYDNKPIKCQDEILLIGGQPVWCDLDDGGIQVCCVCRGCHRSTHCPAEAKKKKLEAAKKKKLEAAKKKKLEAAATAAENAQASAVDRAGTRGGTLRTVPSQALTWQQVQARPGATVDRQEIRAQRDTTKRDACPFSVPVKLSGPQP